MCCVKQDETTNIISVLRDLLSGRESTREGEGNAGHTFSREGNARATVRDCGNLVDLEPNIAVARPAVNVPRGFRHVHVDDARVVDRAVAHDAHLRAGSHCRRRRRARLRRVVAAEVGARDVRDRCLGVEVVRLAHVHPLRCRRAIDDERGECVCQRVSLYVSLCEQEFPRSKRGQTVSGGLSSERRAGKSELDEGLHGYQSCET